MQSCLRYLGRDISLEFFLHNLLTSSARFFISETIEEVVAPYSILTPMEEPIGDTEVEESVNEKVENSIQPENEELDLMTKTLNSTQPLDEVVFEPSVETIEEEAVTNLNQFAKENGLNITCLYNVIRGENGRRQHKGWKIQKN